MRMSFGKFKGVLVADLPDDYLEWLHTLDDLREPLRGAVKQEWDSRHGQPLREIPAGVRQMASELVSVGFRKMATIHHPDIGGTNTTMAQINLAAEWLRTLIRNPA